MVDRLSVPQKGISLKMVIQTADFVATKGLAVFKAVTRDKCIRLGLRIGKVGFLEQGTT